MMPTKRTGYSSQMLLPKGSSHSHLQPLVHHHGACHTIAVLSLPPEAMHLPSGDHAAANGMRLPPVRASPAIFRTRHEATVVLPTSPHNAKLSSNRARAAT